MPDLADFPLLASVFLFPSLLLAQCLAELFFRFRYFQDPPPHMTSRLIPLLLFYFNNYLSLLPPSQSFPFQLPCQALVISMSGQEGDRTYDSRFG